MKGITFTADGREAMTNESIDNIVQQLAEMLAGIYGGGWSHLHERAKNNYLYDARRILSFLQHNHKFYRVEKPAIEVKK